MYINIPLSRFARSHGIIVRLAVAMVVVLFALALPALLSSGSDLLSRILPGEQRPIGPQSSGPTTSWSTMLALADQEAAKIDSNAVLGLSVTAAPPGASSDKTYTNIAYTGPVSGSLLITFLYYQPNGGYFSIEMEDAEPEKTLYIDTRFVRPSNIGLSSFNSEDGTIYKDELKDKLSKSRIGPREAVATTWNEALAEAQKVGMKGLSLDPQVTFLSNTNSWNVIYNLLPIGAPEQHNQQTTVMPSTEPLYNYDRIFFSIDAVSGQIKK